MAVVEAVLSNATVTANGSYTFRAGSAPEVVLVYNVAGAFAAGSSLTFRLVEVDPANESTVIGQTVFSDEITQAVAGSVGIRLKASPTIQVVWSLAGTSVGGVTASVFYQDQPATVTSVVASAEGLPLTSTLQNNTHALSVESRPLEMALGRILDELTLIRLHMQTLTDEENPL